MRASKTLLLVGVALALLQIAHYYPQMPETMASHFDAAGRPNGFQSRAVFFASTGGVLASVVVLFLGLGSFLRVVPGRWVNLPHREFWLAPERRAATMEFISGRMEWFGVASVVLLLVVVQAAIEANLTSDPRLDSDSMWLFLGLYVLYVTVWMVRFLRHFRLPDSSSA